MKTYARPGYRILLGATILAATAVAVQAGETIEEHETYERREMKVETVVPPPPPPAVEKKTTVESSESRRESGTTPRDTVNEHTSYKESVETRTTPPPTAPPQVRERVIEKEVIEED
jgi:hypothetical protein